MGHDLVFASEIGTELDPANVRRGFRRIAAAAGLEARQRTPRELRHSFDDGATVMDRVIPTWRRS